MQEKTFVQAVIDGSATIDEVNDYIEKWHGLDEADSSISEFLGMTHEEYGKWLSDSYTPDITLLRIVDGYRPDGWEEQDISKTHVLMNINALANICGYFFNAGFDSKCQSWPNNGYNCRHPEQEECDETGVGCCFQWSCPLENVIPADRQDCARFGFDFEENEYVLVPKKIAKGSGYEAELNIA